MWKQIFTKEFYKTQIHDTFRVIDVENSYTSRRGLLVTIELIRRTHRFGRISTKRETVVYDNMHRRSASNIYWTYCPYLSDKEFIKNIDYNHDGYGYLVNNDSMEHSFIKLSKADIEEAVDRFWERKGIIAQGQWN